MLDNTWFWIVGFFFFMMLTGTDVLGKEPKKYIWGRCTDGHTILPCKIYANSLYINGKHLDVKIIDVTLIDEELNVLYQRDYNATN